MSDLISRQEAIAEIEFGITYAKALNKETGEVTELFKQSNDELRKAIERIKQLPSAEPERKTGHWVYDENGMDWNLPAWVCSECHGRNDMIPTYIRGKDKMIKVEHPLRWAGSKYCPNCGARMDK